QPPTPVTQSAVNLWANQIAEYADENPTTTGSVEHPFTLAHRNTIARQAVGNTVHGQTILAMVGKDVSREGYLSGRGFLAAGGSRAGMVVRDFLARLEHWEQTQHTM